MNGKNEKKKKKKWGSTDEILIGREATMRKRRDIKQMISCMLFVIKEYLSCVSLLFFSIFFYMGVWLCLFVFYQRERLIKGVSEECKCLLGQSRLVYKLKSTSWVMFYGSTG